MRASLILDQQDAKPELVRQDHCLMLTDPTVEQEQVTFKPFHCGQRSTALLHRPEAKTNTTAPHSFILIQN
jgi:hypothetical protein